MATWTVAEYETLKAAVASGLLTVRYDGPPARSVTYQNLESMRSLLAEMDAYFSDQAGEVGYKLAAFRSGL